MTSDEWNKDPESETSAGGIGAIATKQLEFDRLNIMMFGPSDSYLYFKPERNNVWFCFSFILKILRISFDSTKFMACAKSIMKKHLFRV